jgi:hypothetical protein
MGAICGPGSNDFVLWKHENKKTGIVHYMLILDQMWYDPELIIEQERGESLPDFKKRCEKRLGFKPLSKTEHRKYFYKQIKEHQEFIKQYENILK